MKRSVTAFAAALFALGMAAPLAAQSFGNAITVRHPHLRLVRYTIQKRICITFSQKHCLSVFAFFGAHYISTIVLCNVLCAIANT